MACLKALFVAGSHTDIGKTHVACALLRTARANGLTVDAFKPVMSGFDPGAAELSDSGRLLSAMGRDVSEEGLAVVSPWRFAAPLAPPMAARLERQRLELAPMAQRTRDWLAQETADFRLVEGVGGLMSPIAEDGTGLDLMRALELPALLVGGSYLGAISHTLTALEVLRARKMTPLAVVVSQSGDPEAPDFAETAAAVRRFGGGVPVVAATRGGDGVWSGPLLSILREALSATA